KTCIAFANGFGGKIVIGVEDQTRKILGITDKERDQIYDEFPNSLYDSVKPTLIPSIWEKNYGDLSVICIEMPQSPKKPYFLESEGPTKGVYVRIGTSTRRANQEYIEDLVREGHRTTFDEEPIYSQTEILSKARLTTFYGKNIEEKRLLADKVITPSPANHDRSIPTVTGVLFFAEEPEKWIPEAVILVTQFKGSQGRQILQTRELKGPINALAEEALELLSSWLERDFHLDRVYLKGNLPLPKEALREAIINALIHRKYSIPGAIKIALYEDRCEIFNPGCFPGVVELSNLGDGITYLRNPHLARIARKMRLVEKLGSGIRLIFDSCKKVHLEKPEYTEGGDYVKLTFFFAGTKQSHETDEEIILRTAKTKGELTIKEATQLLNISRNTATRKMNELIKKKKMRRSGRGPAVRYHPVH
ncbi:MAG: hypothetical protein K940chlam9_01526, partial [Chlamydiae bacterium]|nr:hypothetical protein [Chlamydiota bacterium]